jgi:hypothetical protein
MRQQQPQQFTADIPARPDERNSLFHGPEYRDPASMYGQIHL